MGMRDFLVFEQDPSAVPPGQHVAYDSGGKLTSGGLTPRPLFSYRCVGAVRARNPHDASRAVVAATRRVGKYAIMEATFVDFTADLAQEPEGDRPVLNP
jgi:hypothetical protein